MALNTFAGGPTVSETIEQSREKQDGMNENDEYNMPKQNLYGEFNPDTYKRVAKEEVSEEGENQDLKQQETEQAEIRDGEKETNQETEIKDGNQDKQSNSSPEDEKKQQEKIDLSKFKENPNYPILERFTQIQGNDGKVLNSTQLADEDLLAISKVLDKNEREDPLLFLKNNLGEINFKNPDTSKYLSTYIDKIQDLNKDEKKEVKDDKNLEKKLALPKEFKTNDILNNENDDVVQLLVKNHTKLPDLKTGEPNFEKDICTTFEVTANKIIEGKNIPRNESFDLAMHDVKNGDIETRYNALSYINTLVNTSEGVKSESSDLSYDQINSEYEVENQEDLDGEIAELSEQLAVAKDNGDTKKVQQLTEEVTKLKDDKSSGEVFKGGKFDKITDNDPLMSNKI